MERLCIWTLGMNGSGEADEVVIDCVCNSFKLLYDKTLETSY